MSFHGREKTHGEALTPRLSISLGGKKILIPVLRDARVSEQQFSSQPVLLARSYESIHLKLGNLTSPSLPAKSHLLPLIFFLHFLAQFAEEADVIYRRRGLLIVKLVSLGAVAEICI